MKEQHIDQRRHSYVIAKAAGILLALMTMPMLALAFVSTSPFFEADRTANNTWQTGYQVVPDQETEIREYNLCMLGQSNDGQTHFIPTATYQEIIYFLAYQPSTIDLRPCPTTTTSSSSSGGDEGGRDFPPSYNSEQTNVAAPPTGFPIDIHDTQYDLDGSTNPNYNGSSSSGGSGEGGGGFDNAGQGSSGGVGPGTGGVY